MRARLILHLKSEGPGSNWTAPVVISGHALDFPFFDYSMALGSKQKNAGRQSGVINNPPRFSAPSRKSFMVGKLAHS